jgi:hypothetical protein
VTVGWIGGTMRVVDPPTLGFDLARRLIPGGGMLAPGNRHYRSGVRAWDWSAQVLWGGSGSNADTVYVEVRQSAIEDRDDDGAPLVVSLVNAGLRLSRLDLAGDAGAGSRRPSLFYGMCRAATTRTHRDGWELRQRPDGDERLTIGSRASERYLRIYVKGDVVRHELEMKGKLAAATGAAVHAGQALGPLWEAEYGRLVRWPSS